MIPCWLWNPPVICGAFFLGQVHIQVQKEDRYVDVVVSVLDLYARALSPTTSTGFGCCLGFTRVYTVKDRTWQLWVGLGQYF
ncbi:MAG: hypothetical protein QGI34_18540 [Candidatus Latescibacteria bacterium]|nr:hypothetical protein [Candidatus Latescibacterota bacterium]